MNTQNKKLSKSERIPKLGSAARDGLLGMLTELEDYKNAKKRWPIFFSKSELEDIETKFANGMTWQDIEAIMSAKGAIPKYSTFRKYIQDAIIPKAAEYKTTGKGRVAIYKANIIRHINFVNFFYNVTDTPMIDNLMKIIGSCEISYNDAIESVLSDLGDSRGLILEIHHELAFGNYRVTDAISRALENRDDKNTVLAMFRKIQENYDEYIIKSVSEFTGYLTSHNMLITQIPNISR